MRKEEVPQDQIKAFRGESKALYATDADGRYRIVASSGWEAEEIVLEQAIAEYRQAAADAWQRARSGSASSLEYHMYRCRMDRTLLAQSTGFFRWRVNRDLRPAAFAALQHARKVIYATALGMHVEELASLPDEP